MKKRTISFLAALALTSLCGITSAFAQGAPDIVWEVPTPSGLDNSIVQFTPDAQLVASIGSKVMPRFRLEEFSVIFTIGSGYRTTTTTFNFSPKGVYQSIISKGDITIKLRKDGSTISSFRGGSIRGSTPANFTPDGAAIAAWDGDSNQTTLWRVADGAVLMEFPDAAPEEGISAIRFSPDGARMVTTGYLAQNPTGT